MRRNDSDFMQRAISLAVLGKGTVSPNPMVGCVIVHDNKIIGEGWHQKAGQPHAEVLAINSVQNQDLLKTATVYVTLEPCAHYGKTPPCADLLVEKQVQRVIIGCTDPNPQVAGKGIAKLEAAGITVQMSELESECLQINKRFFTFLIEKRPYIILKWAQTADGFISRKDFNSKWISNPLSRQLVHKWRTEEDAILVGKNTALYDNPQLNARFWPGKSPLRIVIDHQLALSPDIKLFDNSIPTIVANTKLEKSKRNTRWIQLPEEDFIPQLLHFLHGIDIQSIIVEGGSKTLQDFIAQGLWDEAQVFESLQTFGKGIPAPNLSNRKCVGEILIEQDSLKTYNPI